MCVDVMRVAEEAEEDELCRRVGVQGTGTATMSASDDL